jgi:hypothetical protein
MGLSDPAIGSAVDSIPPRRLTDRVGGCGPALPGRPAAGIIDRPTLRRAGVFRRAIRHEFSRIKDPRRLAMIAVLGFLGGVVLACLIARGEAAGADSRAYWAAGRLWLNGGDPYHPTGPFMPYVYAPWLLPIFVPWSLLPWDVAWFMWRGATVVALLWTAHWAYKQRPLTTATLLVVLAFPLAANLDTGNINLPLALMLFGAQFAGPIVAGLLWSLATSLKWVPLVFIPIIAPRGRMWGIIWLVVGGALTAVTLPATLVQLQVLFAFPRPARIDYLVFIWALVPWAYQNPRAFRWMTPDSWVSLARSAATGFSVWRSHWHRNPDRTIEMLRRNIGARFRSLLGIGGSGV